MSREPYAGEECQQMAAYYAKSRGMDVGLLADLLQAVYDIREAQFVEKRPWDELYAEAQKRFPEATEKNWRDAVFIVTHPIWIY
jgi:hypothetical protein